MPGPPGQEEAEKRQLGEFPLERKAEQSRNVTSVDFLPRRKVSTTRRGFVW